MRGVLISDGALGLLLAGGNALAQDAMKKDAMGKDTMKKDTMMK